MIRGKVEVSGVEDGITYLEARITVNVAGRNTNFRTETAIIDTGFNGWLSLPESTIKELGLTYLGQRPAVQANGEAQLFRIYGVLVSWDGDQRAVLVHQAEGTPLVGMGLLKGSRLTMDVQEGGDVIIEAILSR